MYVCVGEEEVERVGFRNVLDKLIRDGSRNWDM